jgi:hypothetical protein
MNLEVQTMHSPNEQSANAHVYPLHTYFDQYTSAHKRWHPRLTGYRILTVVLTAGFGLSKAALSYCGQSTVPTTLDWLYGVVVFLL